MCGEVPDAGVGQKQARLQEAAVPSRGLTGALCKSELMSGLSPPVWAADARGDTLQTADRRGDGPDLRFR